MQHKLTSFFVVASVASFFQGCPFCRAEIKGTEQIVVDAFDPKRQHNRNSANGRQQLQNDDHDDDTEVL